MRNNFRTYKLAVAFYHSVGIIKLPGHLKDQLVRAAASVVLNLAEGNGRMSPKDKTRFFKIAFGSLRECQAVLDLGGPSNSEAVTGADILAAHLYRLIQNAR